MAHADPPGSVAPADLSEVLMAILDRLDAIETAVAQQADPSTALGEQVLSSLSSFNARLGRLEEAFVRAVEDSGSGKDSVIGEIRRAVADSLGGATAPGAAQETAGLIAEQGERTRRLFERMEEARLEDAARLQGRLVALIEAGAAPAGPSVAEDMSQLVERLQAALGADSARLLAGIEGLRSLLDRHVAETENSLGRRATVATRRLASDFGLVVRKDRPPD